MTLEEYEAYKQEGTDYCTKHKAELDELSKDFIHLLGMFLAINSVALAMKHKVNPGIAIGYLHKETIAAAVMLMHDRLNVPKHMTVTTVAKMMGALEASIQPPGKN